MKRYSMKKSIPMMLAAAAAMAFAVQANASIAVTTTVIPLNPANADDALLAANGWQAIKVSLVASGSSAGVVAWDFAHAVTGFTFTSVGTPGISGPTFQAWSDQSTASPQVLTKGNIATNPSGLPQTSVAASAAGKIDSYFANYAAGYGFTDGDSPNEDNNFQMLAAGHTNQVDGYQASPVSDIGDGTSDGVGSLMTWAGAIKPNPTSTSSTVLKAAPISVDLAYLIVPINANGLNNVRIYGVVNDDKGASSVIDSILNPGIPVTTPEPASVGLLGLGAAGILARRRNKR